MRQLAIPAFALLLFGCGSGGAGSCPNTFDNLGEVDNGSCSSPGDTCAYSTSEWDFGCTCRGTTLGATWICCSTDGDYYRYSEECGSTPRDEGTVCCIAECDYPEAQVHCTCEANQWHCIPTPFDAGTPVDASFDVGTD